MTAAVQAQLPVTPPAPKVTTAEVLAALIRHYRKPPTPSEVKRGRDLRTGEILITEVPSPTGSRRCDLVRIGTWASRGIGIDVHEIKVSRADWLHELDEPAKADAWWPYCSRFWVVVPPGIVDPHELPEGWGLMELPPAGQRRFKVKVAPTPKAAKVTTGLLVELISRADNDRIAEIENLRSKHAGEIADIRRERTSAQAVAQLPYDVKGRLDLLARIEEAIGVKLDTYAGFPKFPPQKITPDELAAFFADAAAHVTVQRRREELANLRDRIEQTATAALNRIQRIDAEDDE